MEESSEAARADAAPTPKPEPELSYEEVRSRLARLVSAKSADIPGIMQRMGYTKLSDIPAARYGELLAAAEGGGLMPPSEVWRPVTGYEGSYEVSDQGRVRSPDRQVIGRDGRTEIHRGRVLINYRTKRGYYEVSLSDGRYKKHRTTHSLVAEAFLGPARSDVMLCTSMGTVRITDCKTFAMVHGRKT